jgi:DNA-binding CsgD family transcriptional regulator/tetratricopeptide (TPR) repeat protein
MEHLLERDGDLAVLADAVEAAVGRRGSVVLVSGEAGIGKTALVTSFLAHAPHDPRVLAGACDDLFTPRPLGPLRDIARGAGSELADALAQGDQHDLFDAVLVTLDHPLHVTVLLVEDIHWADDATFDLLRYVCRRIGGLRGVVVLTYRDEAVSTTPPLQRLLGGFTGVPVHRVRPRPLSLRAVTELLASRRPDPADVQRLTGGNPFYVTELLDAPEATVPPTVVEAVQARLSRLSPAGRDAAQQLSIAPMAVNTQLATRLVDAPAMAEAEEQGVLEVGPEVIRFRHELARRAVEDTLPQMRRIQLHARFLDVLLATGDADPARVVHHAVRAGDVDRLVRHGPTAAADAAAAGAHRQAVAHYARLLPHLERFDAADQADLLEAHALESYYVGDGGEAVTAQQRASELRRRLGHTVALGSNLLWLSRHHWWNGDRAAAEAASAEAVEVLERLDTRGPELAMAYSRRAQLLMLTYDDRAAIGWAERAVALARQLGDDRVLAHALCNLGTSRSRLGHPEGADILRQSLSVALAVDASDDACRSYTNTSWQLYEEHRHDEALRLVREAIAYAEDTEQLAFAEYLRGMQAMILLDTGHLDRAEAMARAVLSSGIDYIGVVPALTVLGQTLTRRGDPGGEAPLRRAWDHAVRAAELQRLGPAVVALAERAWSTDAPHPPLERLARIQALAEQRAHQRSIDQIGYWRWKLGDPVALTSDSGWALQVRGEWRAAAEWWGARGQPFERALALAEADRAEPLLEAVRLLEELPAAPAARKVRARLRELGVRGVPRGPVPATRANPAGLTARQLEVLELLASGLTNGQIAEQLVVSVRTVDHHVSAVLQKLGVATRHEAAMKLPDVRDPARRPAAGVPAP